MYIYSDIINLQWTSYIQNLTNQLSLANTEKITTT